MYRRESLCSNLKKKQNMNQDEQVERKIKDVVVKYRGCDVI